MKQVIDFVVKKINYLTLPKVLVILLLPAKLWICRNLFSRTTMPELILPTTD